MGTLLNRRRYMGGKALPYDAEVEYLQSTETQWIDTGVGNGYSLNVLDIQMGFQHISTQGNYRWLIYSEVRNKYIGIQRNTVSGYIGGYISYRFRVVTGTWRMYYFNGSDNYESVDDFQVIPPTGTLKKNILLFGTDTGTSFAETCRIKYAKISYNNIIVRDLIPVRIGQTGYMYDKVSGQLFGNAGTGDFVLGPDKT